MVLRKIFHYVIFGKAQFTVVQKLVQNASHEILLDAIQNFGMLFEVENFLMMKTHKSLREHFLKPLSRYLWPYTFGHGRIFFSDQLFCHVIFGTFSYYMQNWKLFGNIRRAQSRSICKS